MPFLSPLSEAESFPPWGSPVWGLGGKTGELASGGKGSDTRREEARNSRRTVGLLGISFSWLFTGYFATEAPGWVMGLGLFFFLVLFFLI